MGVGQTGISMLSWARDDSEEISFVNIIFTLNDSVDSYTNEISSVSAPKSVLTGCVNSLPLSSNTSKV